MDILGIAGSPRKEGNTDLLLDEALKAASKSGAVTEKIYLDDMEIRPCRACMVCKTQGRCAVKDDMQDLIPELQQAKAVIIATPVYWFSCSAQTKSFIDRWFSLIGPDYSSQMQGKKGALISVCAQEDPGILQGVEKLFTDIFAFNGMDFTGKVLCPGVLNAGDVKSKPEVFNEARELGQRLCI